MQLLLLAESPSSTSLQLTSHVFSPKQTYILGNYYPEIKLERVTAAKLPTLLSLTIGVPVYALLEYLTFRSLPVAGLKNVLSNFVWVLAGIVIAIVCLLFYKITLISPSGAGMLLQNADGIVISPVSFPPPLSAIAKVVADFSGVIATFILPVFLCARRLLNVKRVKGSPETMHLSE
ncbi:hypothetical protein [Alteromonas gilva]|uniref:Uncharacterized protein n=1 Tax=Alteromonas gilva TaxID=2987522 RepID=A0ABT5L2C6_9ALTE|nr:hypothetical protein [Alteromonas gilva]MDC8831195.1 hypothetical protein [Alteromonas gilva]